MKTCCSYIVQKRRGGAIGEAFLMGSTSNFLRVFGGKAMAWGLVSLQNYFASCACNSEELGSVKNGASGSK